MSKKSVCLVLGGENDLQAPLPPESYWIAVDGGAQWCALHGILPDEVVGDLDSLAPLIAEDFKRRGVPFTQYSSDKDQSDLELAFAHAMNLYPSEIHVFCALGGRLDHLFFNLQFLASVDSPETPIILHNRTQSLHFFHPWREVQLLLPARAVFSVVPLTDVVRGLIIKGAQWEVNDMDIEKGTTRTLSNRAKESVVQVSCKEGSGFIFVVAQRL